MKKKNNLLSILSLCVLSLGVTTNHVTKTADVGSITQKQIKEVIRNKKGEAAGAELYDYNTALTDAQIRNILTQGNKHRVTEGSLPRDQSYIEAAQKAYKEKAPLSISPPKSPSSPPLSPAASQKSWWSRYTPNWLTRERVEGAVATPTAAAAGYGLYKYIPAVAANIATQAKEAGYEGARAMFADAPSQAWKLGTGLASGAASLAARGLSAPATVLVNMINTFSLTPTATQWISELPVISMIPVKQQRVVLGVLMVISLLGVRYRKEAKDKWNQFINFMITMLPKVEEDSLLPPPAQK